MLVKRKPGAMLSEDLAWRYSSRVLWFKTTAKVNILAGAVRRDELRDCVQKIYMKIFHSVSS